MANEETAISCFICQKIQTSLAALQSHMEKEHGNVFKAEVDSEHGNQLSSEIDDPLECGNGSVIEACTDVTIKEPYTNALSEQWNGSDFQAVKTVNTSCPTHVRLQHVSLVFKKEDIGGILDPDNVHNKSEIVYVKFDLETVAPLDSITDDTLLEPDKTSVKVRGHLAQSQKNTCIQMKENLVPLPQTLNSETVCAPAKQGQLEIGNLYSPLVWFLVS